MLKKIHENQMLMEKEREKAAEENRLHLEKLQFEQMKANQHRLEERDQRLQQAAQLREAYAEQSIEKRTAERLAQEQDKEFLSRQLQNPYMWEKGRVEMEEHLKLLDRERTMRENAYISKVKLSNEDLSKKEEEKRLQIKQQYEKEMEERFLKEKMDKERAKIQTKAALREQMEEKEHLLKLKQQREREFRDELQQRKILEEEKEKQKAEMDRQRQAEYVSRLQEQIIERDRKRRFQDVMSEHEQNINKEDLQAYILNYPKINAKIVGVNAPSHLQTTEKQFGTPSKTLSKTTESRAKYNILDDGHEISRKNANFLKIGEQSRPSPNLLQSAIKNMEDPNVIFMRHNTQNRGYGYKPGAERSSFVGSSMLGDQFGRSPLHHAARSQLEPSKIDPNYLSNISPERGGRRSVEGLHLSKLPHTASQPTFFAGS